MSVVHKNTLVNGFLCATRDADPLVRASSLSCLGELCKVLNFRLGNILIEVRIYEMFRKQSVERVSLQIFDLNTFRFSTALHA